MISIVTMIIMLSIIISINTLIGITIIIQSLSFTTCRFIVRHDSVQILVLHL